MGRRTARHALATALLGTLSVVPAHAERGTDPTHVAQAAPTPTAEPEPSTSDDDDFELEEDEFSAGFPDPFERTNRALFWLDQELARWVVDPITSVYQLIVPNPARKAVRRFFLNLDTPSVLVNDLLQREWADAGVTIQRFALNTVLGLGGLFDPAAELGMPRHDSDFGQTLALAGVDSGPFIMLPFFGPSTVRDAFGGLVDLALQPTLYILPFGTLIIYESSLGLSTREAHSEALKMLKESSVDYYSALHNGYSQSRMAHIWDRREGHRVAREPTPGPVIAER